MSNQDTPQQPSTGTELEAIEQDLVEAKVLEEQVKSDEPANNGGEPPSVDGEVATPVVVKKGGIVAWVALLFSLLCLGAIAAAYWFWQQNQAFEQKQTLQWQSQQNEQIQLLEQQLKKQVSEQLVSSQNQIKTQQQQTAQALDARLGAMDARLGEVSQRQPNDWTLAEASYLIRIAGRKLWLEDDIQTAQNLLATADKQISLLNDSSLYPLRESIARDIAALRILPNPRVDDIHLNLSSLIDTIDKLKINTIEMHFEQSLPDEKPDETKAGERSSEESSFWDGFFNSMNDWADDVFKVDYGKAEGVISPLKMPRQQWYLRANLKMTLLQAQVAVLRRDETVFKEAVSRTIEWLKLFSQTDSGVQAATLTLTSLLQDPIRAEYPKTFASEALLNKLLNERLGADYQPVVPAPDTGSMHKQTPQPAAVEQGESL